VLKTYITAAAAISYTREVEAFRRLQQKGGDTGIIGFHGSFTRGDSYHVLLEYADKGTLEDYFEKETPPVDPEEIINFWEALFKILDALSRIHQINPDGTGGPHIFHGYVTLPQALTRTNLFG
jgi:serine/threonine protein kinase